MLTEPAIGGLATAVGLAPIIYLVMTLVVRPILAPDTFDRFGPVIAVAIGVVLALAYAVVTTNPITGAGLLQAVLVGLFGGALSQNVNTAVARLRATP